MKLLLQAPLIKWVLLIAFSAAVAFVMWKILTQLTVQSKYRKMRQSDKKQKPVIVRRTDLIKLSPKQERDRRHAENLIERGEILEGARILESLHLQREAVTILEEGGLIDEACAILVRIQRPNRAAAIFARHGMHVKAAEYYLTAKSLEEAAQQYLEAARTDPTYFDKAGRIYESIPKADLALKAFLYGHITERIITLSFAAEAWLELTEYMKERSNALEIFRGMDNAQMKTFVEKIPIDQRTIPLLAMWSDAFRKTDFLAAVLKRLTKHKTPLTNYWYLLPPDLAAQLCSALSKSVSPATKDGLAFLRRNAHALLDAKHSALAAKIYTVAERHAMAAKCYAISGDLDQCRASLNLAGDTLLLSKFEDAVKGTQNTEPDATQMLPGQWPLNIVKAVCRALENIDPDSDDVAARSPFSMVI